MKFLSIHTTEHFWKDKTGLNRQCWTHQKKHTVFTEKMSLCKHKPAIYEGDLHEHVYIYMYFYS